ncbi:cohesin domain-containing protein [Cellvibrio sp. pealriver]|uniref:cohesin domain-containing protein n=1 Tax=Cellvibrio sp. pealriver TaxID=1622269 RepID=UPI00066FC07E|nr:cohesin domain-containing protein [Cellvibrio sp. pealriver]
MKKIFASLLAFGLSLSLNANAISIDLIADKTTANIGDNIELQVRISGLEGASALGSYDVNVHYDSDLFSISNITWGDAVQGNQLDLLGFGSLQDNSSSLDWLTMLEVSFDEIADLELLQAGEFTLFSILLSAIALGSGDFSLTANTIGDAYGQDLFIDTINSTTVNVNAVAVPEPSGVLLLLVGLIAAALLRSRLSHSSK